ncbi:glycine zipper 2TM domain-containing protein [Erythrobacter sp. F6033]|uniref:glycine zipper 2TM domain-containing protein n=1 Tax=Erythrobacter sp. F6033 TaxID=2926401 RepID=UPI001FF61F29|nr:glycine zipper 2TM domain-containing protein [Erythrobacter sp. F6033]MCK0128065.1 glycine zipper 2TM domain-containing protein [Erythrobacter sp. F6033]
MKKIALVAAAGSLAAFSAPAQAAEFTPNLTDQSMATIVLAETPFEYVANLDDDRWDDDDDYYERRRYKKNKRYRGDRYDRYGRYYEPQRVRRGDRVWRGRDGRYYCKRDNGTTGLIIGAAGGALIGRAIDTRGDRTVGTLLGGALGAVLGREIDRGSARCR